MQDSQILERLLYVGEMRGNSLARYREMREIFGFSEVFDVNARYERLPWIIKKLERRVRNGPYTYLINRRLEQLAEAVHPTVVWVEMGREIFSSTLSKLKRNGARLVNSYSDSFTSKRTRGVSRHYNKSIPLYDVIFTPREEDFERYRRFGARRVEKFWKGYDQSLIRPRALVGDEKCLYSCDVMFAGHWEPDREEAVIAIARNGVKVKVWGDGWSRVNWPRDTGCLWHGKLSYPQYCRALNGASIAISFVSKWNEDTQNSRLFEIPGAGAFMIAERTRDSVKCFDEGVEAEFFSSVSELVQKIKVYVSDGNRREEIARAGYFRALKQYSQRERVAQMLKIVSGL